jgi:hypothetical protein
MNQYVAAGPSLAAFLLAAEVAQQCLVTSRKIAPEFFNRISSFPNLAIALGRPVESMGCRWCFDGVFGTRSPDIVLISTSLRHRRSLAF